MGKVFDNKASDLSKTLDSTANDFVKATVGVTRDAANAVASNPLVSYSTHTLTTSLIALHACTYM